MKNLLIVSFVFCSYANAKTFRFENSQQCVISVSAENFAVNQKAEISVTQNNRIIKNFSGKIQSLSLSNNSLDTLILERSTLLSRLKDKQILLWLRKSSGRESLEHDNGNFVNVPVGYFLVEGYLAPGNFVSNSTEHYCLGSR
jgi:hypothetical protein